MNNSDLQRAVVTLVGCKADLTHHRAVDPYEAELWARSNGMMYFETSSITGDNIELAFVRIADQICFDMEHCEAVGDVKRRRLTCDRPMAPDPITAQLYSCIHEAEERSLEEAERINGNDEDWLDRVRFKPIHPAMVTEGRFNEKPVPIRPIFPPPGRRQRRHTGWPEYAKGHEPDPSSRPVFDPNVIYPNTFDPKTFERFHESSSSEMSSSFSSSADSEMSADSDDWISVDKFETKDGNKTMAKRKSLWSYLFP